MKTHQVAVSLDPAAFASLKRLSAENRAPYATVIALALASLEQSDMTTTSPPTSAALVVYALLPDAKRQTIKELVRNWRFAGGSFSAIAKRLYRENRICGVDNLPLGISTIRGICAL